MRGNVGKLTETQSGIVTVELAWAFYLEGRPRPKVSELVWWLRASSVRRILDLIERASRRPDVERPAIWIGAALKKESSAGQSNEPIGATV